MAARLVARDRIAVVADVNVVPGEDQVAAAVRDVHGPAGDDDAVAGVGDAHAAVGQEHAAFREGDVDVLGDVEHVGGAAARSRRRGERPPAACRPSVRRRAWRPGRRPPSIGSETAPDRRRPTQFASRHSPVSRAFRTPLDQRCKVGRPLHLLGRGGVRSFDLLPRRRSCPGGREQKARDRKHQHEGGAARTTHGEPPVGVWCCGTPRMLPPRRAPRQAKSCLEANESPECPRRPLNRTPLQATVSRPRSTPGDPPPVPRARITVLADEPPIGFIRPELHGHFAEHLGGVHRGRDLGRRGLAHPQRRRVPHRRARRARSSSACPCSAGRAGVTRTTTTGRTASARARAGRGG